MKTFLLFLSLFLGPVLAASCNADNCARAATGTFRSLAASRLADCTSFQACTVTPAPETETEYITSTVMYRKRDASPAPAVQERAAITNNGAVTVCPSVVPTYASACSGSSRYASACSCGGAKPTTMTLAPATLTETSTTYVPPVPTMPSGVRPDADGPRGFHLRVGLDMFDEYDFWYLGCRYSERDDKAVTREIRPVDVLIETPGPGSIVTDNTESQLELRLGQGHSSRMHFDFEETWVEQAATGQPYPPVYWTFGDFDYSVGLWTVLLYSSDGKTIVEYDPADDNQHMYLSDRPTPGFVQPKLFADYND